MNVTRSQQGRITILSVHGAVIAEDLEVFDSAIEETATTGLNKIVLDFKLVPFIDSAGLERLLTLTSEISRRGGDIRIASLNDVCRDIFAVTRLESLLLVFDSREAAVRSLV